MCLTLGLVCVQLLDLKIRSTICRHWKYVSPSDPGVYKWCSIYKYKIQDALEIRLTLGPVRLQLLPHFTAFYGHSPQLSGFPEFFNNSHNVHKRLIVLCTGAFFNTSSNLFWFFKGRGNRVPIYCDSWHNVDILIVVTMLNVDAWRRSSVG